MSMPEPGRRRSDFLAYGGGGAGGCRAHILARQGRVRPGRRNTRGPLRSPPPPPPYAPAPNSEARVMQGRWRAEGRAEGRGQGGAQAELKADGGPSWRSSRANDKS